MASEPLLLTFAQAEFVGEQLHDYWQQMAGEAPLRRDDTAWGDVVQFVLRKARDARDASNG